MSSPMQFVHNTGVHFFLIITFISQLIIYHPIPELRYVTSLDIIPRWFALCVEMVCVQCEGCVRRCGVSALCVCCV